MAQHVEGRLWLICWHQVPCSIQQHEPEVAIYFSPPFYLTSDSPLLLFGPLPGSNIFPVHGVQVLQHSCRVDNIVVLTVIDENPDVPEEDDDIREIAFGDVLFEGVVDSLTARDVVDV